MCQVYASSIHSPIELLHSMISPWPFYHLGFDIFGPFSLATGQLKFLIMVVDYFTKLVRAEAVPQITVERVRHFYLRNIMYRFGLRDIILFVNDMQFMSSFVVEF